MILEEVDIYKPDALRQELEEGFFVGEQATGPVSRTGESFQELYGTGGEDGAKEAFKTYAAGRGDRLYWRVTPEIERNSGKFYMRVLVTNKQERV